MLLALSFTGSFMIIGAAWSKSSFAISLLRISTGWTRVLIWFIIISVNVILGLSALFTWIRCWPLQKMWISSLEGSCWSRWITLHYNMFTAAYSGAMDIVLALLPWKMLWQLPMNKKEKFGALAAMSMGVFAGVTSIIKVQTIPGSGSGDIVDSVQLIILGGAEIVVTIIASSIPILRALARDRGMRTGQHFALDATPSISWSRRRSSRTRNSRGSLDVPEMAQSEVDRGSQDNNGQDRQTSKRVWYKSRKQVKCLSQIVEVDETQSRNRDSGVDVSPV
ncbi:putative integral membrane protein [Eutypa lata UCREL1]|uniref:Putative integral membrane protein n=1 Tax=Eutypa lata (strain UCR-EL1) TaxID=1287681 RepID=M7TIZ7_EUTLA|nr:putative integral membrane protein [Eutypa lata UCREL1]